MIVAQVRITRLDTPHQNKRFALKGLLCRTSQREAPMQYLAMTLLALCLAAGSSSAHHSFAATYLEDQTVTVEGDIVQFLYRNPHSFVHLTAKEKDGVIARYTIEWGGTSQLGAQGVGKDTLKVGDHVVISGNPGRNAEDKRVRLLSLLRPRDGYGWGRRPGEVVN